MNGWVLVKQYKVSGNALYVVSGILDRIDHSLKWHMGVDADGLVRQVDIHARAVI